MERILPFEPVACAGRAGAREVRRPDPNLLRLRAHLLGGMGEKIRTQRKQTGLG
jgi:hypothetical protein